MRKDTRGYAGCLLAAGGAATALLAWAPLATISIDGGIGQRHRDLSVLYVDLPLVALGGALLPLAVWAAGLRWLHRPWLAAVAAVAGLALGVWGLTSWWTPYMQPEFVY
ncbi:hypothetical protein [Streptomyces spongiicola]|nr:hypothetical protein [Streptomyces spongiicola]AWK10337.1 hypothetical protein DDQ41_17115 [Streptomyces spongiicola]